MAAKSLKHKFNSTIADDSNTSIVRPSNWNDDHDLWLGSRVVTATTDTFVAADHMALVQYNSPLAVAATLPQAGSAGFPNGWVTFIRTRGAGTVTITPTTSTINETSSLVLQQSDNAIIFSDGTNYAAIVTRGQAVVAPLPDAGVAQVGTALRWARADHVHPNSAIPTSGRFVWVDANTVSFVPFLGNKIKIDGLIYDIPAAGITATPSGTFVAGVAGALAASTSYFVYAFNNAGTLALDFWSIAGGAGNHSASATPGNVGVEIRTGDNTRTLVGMVSTTGANQFVDAPNFRQVRTWFNRVRVHFIATSTTGFVLNTPGGWVPLNSPTSRVIMLKWADEAIWVGLTNLQVSNSSTAPVIISAGIGMNGSPSPFVVAATQTQVVTDAGSPAVMGVVMPAEGGAFFDFMGHTTAAGATYSGAIHGMIG